MYQFYGPESPYNNSEALARLTALDPIRMQEHLENDIHTLADIEAEKFKVRQHDIIGSPSELFC